MPFTITQPFGRRADDARSLRLRLRRVTFSGNFTAASGEVITAQSIGFKRVFGAIPVNGLAPQSDQSTANEVSVLPASDFTSLTLKLYENAAAGSPSALKSNAEAYTTGQFVDLLFIGF